MSVLVLKFLAQNDDVVTAERSSTPDEVTANRPEKNVSFFFFRCFFFFVCVCGPRTSLAMAIQQFFFQERSFFFEPLRARVIDDARRCRKR